MPTLGQLFWRQQELQRVGATPFEQHATNLFGGVQRSELPQTVQDEILKQTQQAGGRPGGPLTITNPFSSQEVEPPSALESLSGLLGSILPGVGPVGAAASAGMGLARNQRNEQVQQQQSEPASGIGTILNPFVSEQPTISEQKAQANKIAQSQGALIPFPEAQQKPEIDGLDPVSVARAAQQQSLRLMKAGLISAEDGRSLVKQAAVDSMTNIRDTQTARGIAKALKTQYDSGQISEQQLSLAMEAARSKYGRQLINAPEWQALTGTEGAYQQHVTQMVAEKAQSLGLPAESHVFNPKTGQIERNEDWFQTDAYLTKKKTEELKPVLKSLDARVKAEHDLYMADMKVVWSHYVPNMTEDELRSYQKRIVGANDRHQRRLLGLDNERSQALGGEIRLPETPQYKNDKLQPPPGVEIPVGANYKGAFNNYLDAQNSKPKNNDYLIIDGYLFRVNANGKIDPVQ